VVPLFFYEVSCAPLIASLLAVLSGCVTRSWFWSLVRGSGFWSVWIAPGQQKTSWPEAQEAVGERDVAFAVRSAAGP